MIDVRHSESDPHNKIAWHYQILWEFSTSKDFYHEFYASKQNSAKQWLGVIWTLLYYVKGMNWHGPVTPKHEHRKSFTVQHDKYGILSGDEVEDFYGILKLLIRK